MEYTSFNTKFASEYGIEEAIMIENLSYWIEKNAANNKHYHDGRFWTYNSAEAFTKLFPFWSQFQIKRILTSLESKGIILKGEFNESAYDRTRWYAFTDGFLQKLQLDRAKSYTREDEIARPIPNNYQNTNISSSSNEDSESAHAEEELFNSGHSRQSNPTPKAPSQKKDFNTADFVNGLVEIGVDEQVARDWVKQRMAKRLSQTSTALSQAIREFNKIQGRTPNELILFAIERGWGGFKAEWFNNEISRRNDSGRNIGNSAKGIDLFNDGRERHYTSVLPSTDELLGNKGPSL